MKWIILIIIAVVVAPLVELWLYLGTAGLVVTLLTVFLVASAMTLASYINKIMKKITE